MLGLLIGGLTVGAKALTALEIGKIVVDGAIVAKSVKDLLDD